MSEKHTPGPWTAYCRDVDHKEGVPWSEDKFLQWEVSGPRVPDGRGEYYEADARLIAAAPELLAALKRIVDWDDAGLALTQDHAAQARAAIAKVEGGAA